MYSFFVFFGETSPTSKEKKIQKFPVEKRYVDSIPSNETEDDNTKVKNNNNQNTERKKMLL
jgi:hypothetical protein